jgi:hypothetical protein
MNRVGFSGIGNVSAVIISREGVQSLVSHNGIVGHEMRRAAEFVYGFPPGATLLMMSDGVSTQARPESRPGLMLRHPALIAGVVFRDYARGRDDATVLAWRAPVGSSR